MTAKIQPRIRVRIAPSPTGDPHVGTAYIALFNLAFARSQQGTFILRIEDTDRERSSKESEEAILHSLRWLGLDWDEGPDVGGPHGPYRQSERSDVYRRYAGELVERGAAYPCFCTPERLAKLREEQRRQKLSTLGYDRHCRRNVSPEEAKARLAAGEPHVIRLAVPEDGETRLADLIRGEVVIQNATIDDQVLLKSDGFPTYHLASVVDDHLMEISHVVRAEEWISSTPKHLLLYQAFGWEPPAFAHMPLLRNPNRSKISKRKNPTSLRWYEQQGYLPEALLNFLALMGWSAAHDQEVFSLDQMIAEFDWRRVAKSGPVFDMQKLDWLNGVYIRRMERAELARRIKRTVLADTPVDEQSVERTIPIVQERMKRLTDYVPLTRFLFEDVSPSLEDLAPKKTPVEKAGECLKEALGALESIRPGGEWNAEALEKSCRAVSVARHGGSMSAGKVFMCLRVAVTGSRVSPPLFESMELLGRERTLGRIKRAISRIDEAVRRGGLENRDEI